jgi:hypothetical protein
MNNAEATTTESDGINYWSASGSYLVHPWNENDVLYFGLDGPERCTREDATQGWVRVKLTESRPAVKKQDLAIIGSAMVLMLLIFVAINVVWSNGYKAGLRHAQEMAPAHPSPTLKGN